MMAVELRDVFIFAFRLLTVAILTCTILACVASLHDVTIDKEAIVEQFLGYNCSDFSNFGKEVCETTNEILRYHLWGVKDEFNIFRRQRLCTRLQNPTENYGFNVTGSIREIVEGNLGDCSEAALISAAVFSVVATIFALSLVIWITIVSDHHENGHYPVKVHLWLNGSLFLCSLIVVCIYAFTMNPMRQDPTFCERQNAFRVCQQETGAGFWLLLSSLVMCFVNIGAGLFARKKGFWGYEREHSFLNSDGSKIVFFDRKFQFCQNLHLWIKLGRLAEFLLMLVGVVGSFTSLYAVVPPGSITQLQNVATIEISNRINLWQDVFCSYNLLWWSSLIQEPQFPFGHCDENTLFHVQFASIKVLVSSGLALVLKRDAKENPLFYLIGIVMDFLSLIFISLAIGLFRGRIFPGREAIQPAYCTVWAENVGTDCSIQLGNGFYIYCTVLFMTTVNFFTEFCIAERGQQYGARSAWDTISRRVRQRRFKSIHKPTTLHGTMFGAEEERVEVELQIGRGVDLKGTNNFSSSNPADEIFPVIHQIGGKSKTEGSFCSETSL